MSSRLLLFLVLQCPYHANSKLTGFNRVTAANYLEQNQSLATYFYYYYPIPFTTYLMAIFNPENVCIEHGTCIYTNKMHITQEWNMQKRHTSFSWNYRRQRKGVGQITEHKSYRWISETLDALLSETLQQWIGVESSQNLLGETSCSDPHSSFFNI